MDNNNLLVSLDVGTSKVAVIVAELNGDGAVRICGFGSSRSEGVRCGMVVDISAAVRSIRAALDEAEQTSGRRIDSVCTACEDRRLRFLNHTGATPVRGAEIVQADVDAAVANAKEIDLKPGEKVLKILIQEFGIDGEGGILRPQGMMANRLEASVHVVCGQPAMATNLLRSVRRSGVEVMHWGIPAWASADAVLTESERELGVCVVDLGAGTMDIAAYFRGSVRCTSVIPVGGGFVTKDIAAIYRLDEKTAEEVKLRYGSADPSRFTAADVVDLSEMLHADMPIGKVQVIAQEELAEVIEARLREILRIARKVLSTTGIADRIPAGVVFTGGVSQTDGFLKLAEEELGQRCRIGAPDAGQTVGGMGSSPAWASAVGLLKDAAREAGQRRRAAEEHKLIRVRGGFWDAVKHWFIGNY